MSKQRDKVRGMDDVEDGGARWRAVYAAVVVFTVLVIFALWWFSRAFSS